MVYLQHQNAIQQYSRNAIIGKQGYKYNPILNGPDKSFALKQIGMQQQAYVVHTYYIFEILRRINFTMYSQCCNLNHVHSQTQSIATMQNESQIHQSSYVRLTLKSRRKKDRLFVSDVTEALYMSLFVGVYFRQLAFKAYIGLFGGQSNCCMKFVPTEHNPSNEIK